ncbi:hypothetical protein NCLIV_012190 [Neospora caninum Liverpool]|uniref:DNA-directed DNA polymerase n=1 Tax=Neospora caninum (strain Liverpool) TaxID=572307 RepID=F0V9Z0_NEOCL|nr:hypothetical protein NCLIV_012190 [Neospora caninum Liverpool]CBZ50752.1 hypothetical protein NCLIV_012190 [Neospora caninum Liverpool]|eukprot:XP_003880785.1 hypothetical protein NCLIV_012190 [Neospora caninum Liverpool]
MSRNALPRERGRKREMLREAEDATERGREEQARGATETEKGREEDGSQKKARTKSGGKRGKKESKSLSSAAEQRDEHGETPTAASLQPVQETGSHAKQKKDENTPRSSGSYLSASPATEAASDKEKGKKRESVKKSKRKDVIFDPKEAWREFLTSSINQIATFSAREERCKERGAAGGRDGVSTADEVRVVVTNCDELEALLQSQFVVSSAFRSPSPTPRNSALPSTSLSPLSSLSLDASTSLPAFARSSVSPAVSSFLAPPASLCTLLCLFEDGTTTTRSSKRLTEARYLNRTYRSRFPEPVAFLLSLAYAPPGEPTLHSPCRAEGETGDAPQSGRRRDGREGGPGEKGADLVLANRKTDTDEDQDGGCRERTITHFRWLHVLLPCNARLFGDTRSLLRLPDASPAFPSSSSDSTPSCCPSGPRFAREEKELTEKIWETVRLLAHVEGLMLRSGGPTFCFSAQDTLRPLLQRFPKDVLGFRTLLDGSLVHWLLHPDDPVDTAKPGALEQCVLLNEMEAKQVNPNFSLPSSPPSLLSLPSSLLVTGTSRDCPRDLAPRNGKRENDSEEGNDGGEIETPSLERADDLAAEAEETKEAGVKEKKKGKADKATRQAKEGDVLEVSDPRLAAFKEQLELVAEDKGASGVSSTSSFHWSRIFHDAILLARLSLASRHLLRCHQLVQPLLTQEIPMASLLALLDVTGIAIQPHCHEQLKSALDEALVAVEKEVNRTAGTSSVQVSSPAQLSNLLFDHLALPLPARTFAAVRGNRPRRAAKRTLARSTAEEILQEIVDLHPVVPLIQNFRSLAKLRSTYLESTAALSLSSSSSLSAPEGASFKVAFKLYDEVPAGEADVHRNERKGKAKDGEENSEGSISLADAARDYPALYPTKHPRVFTRWNQTRTVTGRLSSSYPNLQNIPKVMVLPSLSSLTSSSSSCSSSSPSSDVSPSSPSSSRLRYTLPKTVNCREAFRDDVQDGSAVVVAADYAQIEMRLLAHFCGKGPLQSLLTGRDTREARGSAPDDESETSKEPIDLYREMAALYAEIPPSQVTKELRDKVKVTCLALIYGSGTCTIARQMNISLAAASAFRSKFLFVFPDVSHFIRSIVAKGREDGFVTTLTGRRRYIPEAKSNSSHVRALGERLSVNSCIQGSASDIMKIAMMRLQAELLSFPWDPHALPPRVLLSVHDELVMHCSLKHLQPLSKMIRKCLTENMPVDVPLDVSISAGPTWGTLTKLAV